MRRDRHAGLAVRLRDRAQNPLDSRRDAGFVRRALENCRLDARVRDALGDVADEHVCHGFGSVQFGARAGEVEEHWYVVVGVHTGRDDYLDIGRRGDTRNAGMYALAR